MEYLEKISDRIYAHTKGKTIGNIGVIVADHGSYIIDTSMYPVVARKLRTEIESVSSKNVIGALLTHYHFDHSGGNQVFHDVGIHSHVNALDNMKSNYDQVKMKEAFDQREDNHLFEGLKLTHPTITFETSPYSPDDSGQIEIYHTGGHTSGSSLIYDNQENVMFAGDNLFAGLFPWGGDPTASPYDWLHATEFIKSKSPDIIVPGHGDVQYNLKEVDHLNTYLQKVIETGTKLVEDDVSSEIAIETLSEISSHPEKNEGMKQKTLEHWFNVFDS